MMNERLMQDALRIECVLKRHRLVVPNVTLFGWESDLVSVTGNDYLCEYEIKVSRSDFKRDAKKFRHQYLTERPNDNRLAQPAYLYYVVVPGVAGIEEIPPYAGLLVVDGCVETLRRAPRLHMRKMSERERQWLERALEERYWQTRRHL